MQYSNNFTNLYPLSKTIRFRLIPQGNTLENIKEYLENDEERNEDTKIIKEIITRYDRKFIQEALSTYEIEFLDKFYNLSLKNDDSSISEMKTLPDTMRKMLVDEFQKYAVSKQMKLKDILSGEIIKKINDDIDIYCFNDKEKEIVNKFSKFSTYLKDFCENRSNIYSIDAIPSAFAYRAINENLNTFVKNIKIGKKAIESLDENDLKELTKYCLNEGEQLCDYFNISYYNNLLLQNGIDRYNNVLGGYSLKDGKKIKGLNELINLHNQANKDNKLALLEVLDKQILGEKETYSFILESYKDDSAVFDDIDKFYNDFFIKKIKSIKSSFSDLKDFNLDKIYLKNGPTLTTLSNNYLGSWDTIKNLISNDYDEKNGKKDTKKYVEEKEKYLKNEDSFSIEYIQNLVNNNADLHADDTLIVYIADYINRVCEEIEDNYKKYKDFINNDNNLKRVLSKNDKAIVVIKAFLDSCKELQHTLYMFSTNSTLELDPEFINPIIEFNNEEYKINDIYNKVRNYVTKKPYSTDKIRLSFDNVQLLSGWDLSKEKDCLGTLYIKDNNYYLGIFNKNNKKVLDNIEEANDNYYEKMEYKQLRDPSMDFPHKFFSKKNLDIYKPSDYILDGYENGKHKKGEDFDIRFCHDLIDFYKKAINMTEDWSKFSFKFKDTKDYKDIREFYADVKNQSYKLSFKKISSEYIDNLVNEGDLYLFQIYSKDFSNAARKNGSKKNLHTMYFEALFNKDNLNNLKFKLNGGAMMFYRKASLSLKDTAIHKANEAIKNKNDLNGKKESKFNYDLIKDKRYTEDQFFLHLPITINPNAKGISSREMNVYVRDEIKKEDSINIIGIDRGERNLLYVSVIDSKGKILEQKSLNVIENKYNDIYHKTDYHALLDNKEKDRLAARQNWNTIENIKELKEGYLSVCVNEIVKLVRKYNALIALEDLNSGFKNSRTKVEKQVYQKFEKQLIEKLNYVVDKETDSSKPYGVVNGLQLSNKFESFKAMSNQNGIIFYVAPWLTSKIDPTTGFANLLHPKYENQNKAHDFISSIDSISYDKNDDLFKFDVDYRKFSKTESSYKKQWQIYSYGKRIKNFRNPEKNNQWDSKEVDITKEYKELFNKYEIDINKDIKTQILDINKKELYERFINLFSLTLQMRNSVTGTDIDYMVSPVKNSDNKFFVSDVSLNDLPKDADANGAYHIALKLLMIINRIRDNEDVSKVKTAIKNEEWLKYAQGRFE